MAQLRLPNSLRGSKILIVEDEAILALDLSLTIEDHGGSVVGPLHRLAQAINCPQLYDVDLAILDVDIRGEEVFPLADKLAAAGVSIVFHTGRTDVAQLSAAYPAASILRKPCAEMRLVDALCSAIMARRRSPTAMAG